jgi:hypothetical protein
MTVISVISWWMCCIWYVLPVVCDVSVDHCGVHDVAEVCFSSLDMFLSYHKLQVKKCLGGPRGTSTQVPCQYLARQIKFWKIITCHKKWKCNLELNCVIICKSNNHFFHTILFKYDLSPVKIIPFMALPIALENSISQGYNKGCDR